MAAREIAGKFVDAFNAHDEKRMKALTAEDAVLEAPGDITLEGRDETTGYAMGWLNAFPGATVTVHSTLEDGDWIVQRFTFEGTHDGILSSPIGDIQPTHRHVTGRSLQVLRIKGDTIAETYLYFDQVQLMTQLGLMPEPAHA